MTYISSLNYHLPDQHDIKDLSLDEELKNRLIERGQISKYFRNTTSCINMASATASSTLSIADIDPHDIDAVIVASSSVKSRPHLSNIDSLLQELRLNNAVPYLVSMGECVNFHRAMSTAVPMVAQQQFKTILIITVDSVEEGFSGQQTDDNQLSILSDAAASCILSNKIEYGISVLGRIHTHYYALNRDQHVPPLSLFGNDLTYQIDLALNAVGLSSEDISCVVADNLNYELKDFYSLVSDIDDELVFTENISRTAHCFCCDNIINIHDLIESNQITDNDYVLVIATASREWGFFIAQYRKN